MNPYKSGWSAGIVMVKMGFMDGTTEMGSLRSMIDHIGISDAVMQHFASR